MDSNDPDRGEEEETALQPEGIGVPPQMEHPAQPTHLSQRQMAKNLLGLWRYQLQQHQTRVPLQVYRGQ